MLLFAAALTLLTTLLFGFAPACRPSASIWPESLQGRRRERVGRARAAGPARRARGGADGAGRAPAARRGPDAAEPRRAAARGPGLRAAPRPDAAAAPARGELREAGVGRRVLPRAARARARRCRACAPPESSGRFRSRPTIGDWGLDVEGYVEPRAHNAKGDWQVVSDGALEALGERLVARPLARRVRHGGRAAGRARQRDARADVLAGPGPDRQAPAHGLGRRPAVDDGRGPRAGRAAQRRDAPRSRRSSTFPTRSSRRRAAATLPGA